MTAVCGTHVHCSHDLTIAHDTPPVPTGNILEDETAVGVITAAKALGNSVAIKQQQAEETEAAIDAARLAYAPAGDHASTLFFCISGEPEIHFALRAAHTCDKAHLEGL